MYLLLKMIDQIGCVHIIEIQTLSLGYIKTTKMVAKTSMKGDDISC